LEKGYQAEIVGMSHSLADQEQLRTEVQAARHAEVIAVEIKAASVDVVARFGQEKGIEVVYIDNHPVPTESNDDLDAAFLDVATMAKKRFS
jgi:cyclic 2,3-diphosphoglycerate synthetase